MRQSRLMKFDPVDGKERPYPSMAAHYRTYHKHVVWRFDPWSGQARTLVAINIDPEGLLLTPIESMHSTRTPEFKITQGTALGVVVDPMAKVFIDAASKTAPEKMPRWADELQKEYLHKLLAVGIKLT